jgi:prepilin signal peptidase PulO-like enzyme (type II secretory pathway)
VTLSSFATIAVFGLLVVLLAHLSWFDLRHHRIADAHSLGVLALALATLLVDPVQRPFNMALGVMTGGLSLEVLRRVYRRVRGKDGLGFGDVKFVAAAGAWVGPLGIPYLVLLASVSGLAFAILLHLFRGTTGFSERIAFGPHLAVGLLVCAALQHADLL